MTDVNKSTGRAAISVTDETKQTKLDESRSTVAEPTDVPEGIALQGSAFAMMFGSTIFAVLLGAFNATILGTATPSITAQFHTVDDVGWYAAAYLISQCAMTPLMGVLYRMFNIKILFLVMIAIFEAGAAIGGSAPSSNVLIVARAISGIGGSGLLTGLMTIVAATVPLRKRALINGVAMGCLTVGQIAGPIIGGSLASYASWRWCLYINLPMGGAVFIIFALFVKLPVVHLTTSDKTILQKLGTIDLVGFVLFSSACVMLLLGLEWGGTTYKWSSPVVVGMVSGGAATFVCMAIWTYYKGDKALIPPRLVRNRVNIALVLTAFVQGGGVYTATFWLPIWFQGVKDASPVTSGLSILPMAISQLISSVVCGLLVQRMGYYLPEVMAGNVLVSIGAGLMSTFRPDTTEGEWIGYQILVGAGRGFVLQLLPTAMQTNLPAEDASLGSAIIMFAQYLGGALFASIAKTVFTSTIRITVPKYVPGLDPDRLINTGVISLRDSIPADQLAGAIMAYNESVDRVFDVQLASACAAVVTGAFVGWRKIHAKKKPVVLVPTEDNEKRVSDVAQTDNSPV